MADNEPADQSTVSKTETSSNVPSTTGAPGDTPSSIEAVKAPMEVTEAHTESSPSQPASNAIDGAPVDIGAPATKAATGPTGSSVSEPTEPSEGPTLAPQTGDNPPPNFKVDSWRSGFRVVYVDPVTKRQLPIGFIDARWTPEHGTIYFPQGDESIRFTTCHGAVSVVANAWLAEKQTARAQNDERRVAVEAAVTKKKAEKAAK